eukprot:TRINITY_DN59774_c0_g1_i1.p1 TRINITY_DN59774_c0_g1~~TRINITY_DN59774_c0_g1_i1.p1  ORF type:complete len:538 (-),score=57.15 TRINITY_DN59774_c0_g1_i1:401-2014(-)
MISDIIFSGCFVDTGPFRWKVGDRFIATRLNRTEYNGEAGRIIGELNESTERFAVKLDKHPQSIQLRPQNMAPFFPLRVTEDGIPCWYAEAVPTPLTEAQKCVFHSPLSGQDIRLMCDTIELQESFRVRPDCLRTRIVPSLNRSDLVVKKSSIPDAGLGVFACDAKLPQGTELTQYSGWFEGLDRNFTRYNYNGIAGDPSVRDSRSGVAQVINDAGCISAQHVTSRTRAQLKKAYEEYQLSLERCNVTLEERGGAVVAVARKDICPGEELFFHYGADYWLGSLRRLVSLSHDIELVRLIEEFMEDDEEHDDKGHSKLRLEFDKRGNPKLVHDGSKKLASDEECYWMIRTRYGGLAKWECQEIILCDLGGGTFKHWKNESPYRQLLTELIAVTACVYLLALALCLPFACDSYVRCQYSRPGPSCYLWVSSSMRLKPQKGIAEKALKAGFVVSLAAARGADFQHRFHFLEATRTWLWIVKGSDGDSIKCSGMASRDMRITVSANSGSKELATLSAPAAWKAVEATQVRENVGVLHFVRR